MNSPSRIFLIIKKKKEIKISSYFIKDLFKSVFISMILLFIINHFGEFKYENWVVGEHYVTYETLFGNKVYSDTNFLTSNNWPKFGEVETYFEKLPYYIYSIFVDFIPLAILIIILLLYFIIKRKFHFKIG